MKISHNSIPAIVIISLTLFLYGCKEEPKSKPKRTPPKVTVARPVVQDVTSYIYFTGHTDAKKTVDIRARVEGFLNTVSFESGTMVKEGDLLFNIDPKQLDSKVIQAKADLRVKKAEADLASASLQRKESAFKEKAVSELAVLEDRAAFSKAQAEVKSAEAQLMSAQLDLSYTEIRAPLAGQVGRNLVDEGNLVGAGGEKTLLTSIVQFDPIFAYFNVDERSLLLYKSYNRGKSGSTGTNSKQPVFLALEGDDGYPYSGYVDYVDNTVDKDTGTIQVRAIFENHDLYLLPGLFVKIRIPYREIKNGLLVPDAALASDQRGRYLLVVNNDNTVEYKPVTVGSVEKGMRVIKTGITADDRVIVKGIQRARPGSSVTAIEENQKQQSADDGKIK